MEYLKIGLLIYFLVSRGLISIALIFLNVMNVDLSVKERFMIFIYWMCPIWADYLYLGIVKRLIQGILGIEIRE